MSYALSIRQLCKTYDNTFQALNNIDLTVEPGDFFALLGPNGAGKSTTIGIICSLINKTSGEVKVFDHNIDTHFTEVKRNIGVVPQEFNFNQFEKVYDIVVTQAGYFGLPRHLAAQRAEKYLKQLGLWEKRDDRSRMLSGGMKRRLMIARALVHEPRLLILDEPTAGVDIELRRSMWAFLREINAAGTTIILTTHYLEEAESLCRNIAIINHGKIVKNCSVKDLLRELNTETFLLDVETTLTETPKIVGYQCTRVDDATLEVAVKKGQSLNDVFTALAGLSISVTSMRNKTNRLEELFVSIVGAHRSDDENVVADS